MPVSSQRGAMVGLALLAGAASARALDKQGSAHGGDVVTDDGGVHVAGSAAVGLALYNPSYAARPDNTGLTLMRYAVHADIDLIGPRLSIPDDLNAFTDRERGGARVFLPSELDLISGVTTTWRVARPLAFEAGARVEHDRAVDRGTRSQTYVDVRTRVLVSLAAALPEVGPALREGDVSGWLTLGVFAYNPSYFARPDNTGLALFRYAPHIEVALLRGRLTIGLDGTMFTDRTAARPWRPSELDLTPEVALCVAGIEVHLAYERDMPLDRAGLVQQWVYATLVYGFRLQPAGRTATPAARDPSR